MRSKQPKTCCIAIDASIGHAAGTLESLDPTGTRCSHFMIAVRSVCHRMAWSEAIKFEWDKHQSTFATRWLVTMMNLKKLRSVMDEPLEELREAIAAHSKDKNVMAIMLKDAHLIEAALATDVRVASLDEAARGHYSRLAATFVSLRPVIWVNPAIEGEPLIKWLEQGAPDRPARRLKG